MRLQVRPFSSFVTSNQVPEIDPVTKSVQQTLYRRPVSKSGSLRSRPFNCRSQGNAAGSDDVIERIGSKVRVPSSIHAPTARRSVHRSFRIRRSVPAGIAHVLVIVAEFNRIVARHPNGSDRTGTCRHFQTNRIGKI